MDAERRRSSVEGETGWAVVERRASLVAMSDQDQLVLQGVVHHCDRLADAAVQPHRALTRFEAEMNAQINEVRAHFDAHIACADSLRHFLTTQLAAQRHLVSGMQRARQHLDQASVFMDKAVAESKAARDKTPARFCALSDTHQAWCVAAEERTAVMEAVLQEGEFARFVEKCTDCLSKFMGDADTLGALLAHADAQRHQLRLVATELQDIVVHSRQQRVSQSVWLAARRWVAAVAAVDAFRHVCEARTRGGLAFLVQSVERDFAQLVRGVCEQVAVAERCAEPLLAAGAGRSRVVEEEEEEGEGEEEAERKGEEKEEEGSEGGEALMRPPPSPQRRAAKPPSHAFEPQGGDAEAAVEGYGDGDGGGAPSPKGPAVLGSPSAEESKGEHGDAPAPSEASAHGDELDVQALVNLTHAFLSCSECVNVSLLLEEQRRPPLLSSTSFSFPTPTRFLGFGRRLSLDEAEPLPPSHRALARPAIPALVTLSVDYHLHIAPSALLLSPASLKGARSLVDHAFVGLNCPRELLSRLAPSAAHRRPSLPGSPSAAGASHRRCSGAFIGMEPGGGAGALKGGNDDDDDDDDDESSTDTRCFVVDLSDTAVEVCASEGDGLKLVVRFKAEHELGEIGRLFSGARTTMGWVLHFRSQQQRDAWLRAIKGDP